MNGERGIDSDTDFQRAYVCVTITEEKTSLLVNNETKELLYIEEPIIKKGYANYHLHILYPEKDNVTGKKNNSLKGDWSIEELKSSNWNPLVGSFNKTVVFDPEIHSKYCKKILASTENLMEVNPDSDLDEIIFYKNPHFDRTKKKDVYNICSSLIEIYAKMQGELSYIMVQPFYSSYKDLLHGGEEYTHVEYKIDINNFIAVFPAIAYNKARLESQLY